MTRRIEWLRWSALAAAVTVLVVFLVVQRQSVDVSYGRSSGGPGSTTTAASAGETDATVPSVEQMTALVAADLVVRLPGAVAHFDEQRIRAVAGGKPVRVLIAPPGLDKAERRRVSDVENATIRIVGTEVSGGIYQVTADSLAGWRAQFATGDVTNQMVALLTEGSDRPTPDVDALTRREPTAAELAAVLPDLRRTDLHVAAGATLDGLPTTAAAAAFPGIRGMYLALPQQPYGRPVPRFGPALAAAFPGAPIVVLYGNWIEYDGPQAADFAELAGASFYGQVAGVLSPAAYPQRNVLGAYLNRVIDVRYAGLFDRPLPYRPFDPLRVALPALPWLFGGCVLAFLVLSVTRARHRTPRDRGVPARLAGLTALALDLSAITRDPALTRGITTLTGAAEALDEQLPDRHTRRLLDRAEAELDAAARALPYRGYRPADYLREVLS